MARNGSGTYSNPYPNFISGTVISSSEVDANNSDIATALTQSIAVDGQSVVTGDIPLATHKFTAMKVGTAATDSLSLGQAQAEAFVWCGTAGGGADAITLSPSPAITAYAAGQRFVWMASGSTNTGATTVAISGLGAIALQDNGAALTAGQHAAGKMFMGVLNTTSTVQIMNVQVSGTDPLIISSLTVTGDATIGDDLTLLSDASILGFGENTDVTLTHVHDTGLLLNSTRQLQFNDASQYINAPTATVLDINATDEIELNATAVDINATLDVSGNSVLASVDVTGVATAATFEPDGDTSAGDNAALGYTSVLGAILTGQGSTNDVTLVNDADATVLGIPTGTTNVTMAGDLAVSGGITGATSINGNQIGTRNLIMNGEMRGAQRGTSATGIGNGDAGYHTLDRWRVNEGGTIQAEVTMSQDSDVPAGKGFSNSLKLDVTTAESAVAADERFIIDNIIEGQDLTQLKFGTSDAMSLTLSFWIKSTKTGTYAITLYNGSPSTDRILTKTYTVDSTNTWEKKTLTWVGDTDSSSPFADDNAAGLFVQWWFMAGSNFTDGTVASSWSDWDDGKWGDAMVNAFDSTSNNVYLTGVQLEAGSTATDYEHRTFGDELRQCQRYFEKIDKCTQYSHPGNSYATNATVGHTLEFAVTKRTAPTLTVSGLGTSSGQIGVSNAQGNYVSGQPSSIAANTTVHHAGIYFLSGNGISGLTDDSIASLYGSGSSYFHLDADL